MLMSHAVDRDDQSINQSINQSTSDFYNGLSNREYFKVQCQQEKFHWNRKVFSQCWNESTDDAETTLSGSAFQILAAVAGKAQISMAEEGSSGRLSKRRPNTSARQVLVPGTAAQCHAAWASKCTSSVAEILAEGVQK